jgi:protein involved in polysaccharide export with SLBB domain
MVCHLIKIVKAVFRFGSTPWFARGMVCLILMGCNDNRISLNEFLRMQSEPKDDPCDVAVTTQSAPVDVDRYLTGYKVGPDDVLGVTLTRIDDMGLNPPIQVRVNHDGNIHMPLVGTVQVHDKSLEEVELAIHNAYVPDIYRDLSVHAEVLKAEPVNVMVVGAVLEPGLIPLRRTERNVLFAIVGAGGVSSMASGEITLRRIRSDEPEIKLNLMNPDDFKQALAMEPLENGDMLSVKAAVPNVIFVGGLVNAPQPEVFPPGVQMSVLQAIAGAGGLRTDLTPKEATLIRRMENGADVHVRLELDRITCGRDPNIALTAGDILWVPHTWETRVQEWINQHFFLRFGAAATVNYNVNGIEYLNRASQQNNSSNGGSLQDTYDPFGFLNRNAALQNLTGTGKSLRAR